MPYKILIALDFSKLGREVADYGYELGRLFKGDLTFMHVIPEPSVIFNSYAPAIPIIIDSSVAELRNSAQKKLDFYISEASRNHPDMSGKYNVVTVIEVGDSAQCIIEYAKNNAFDLIVLGYRGHSAIGALLVGSTANKVTRYAPCSVLIYRPDKAEA